MRVDESLGFHTSKQLSSNPLTLDQTSLVRADTEIDKSDEMAVSDIAWLFFPIWFVMLLTILTFAASETWKVTRDGLSTLKQLHRIPCRSCRFFSRNLYLQCAVRPSDALTERAIACSDYRAKHVDKVHSKTY